MDEFKIAFFNGQEFEFPKNVTAEEIRSQLSTVFPSIDNAKYTVDEVTGNVSFIAEGGVKGL